MNSAEIRLIDQEDQESRVNQRQKETAYALGRLAILARHGVDEEFAQYGNAIEAAVFTYEDLREFLRSQKELGTRMAHYAMRQFQEAFINRYELADIDLAEAKTNVTFPLSLVAAALYTGSITGDKSKRVWQGFLSDQTSRLRSQA